MTTSYGNQVKELLLPMNQTSVTPDWGFSQVVRTVKIGSNQVFPKVASYTGNGGTYASFHQRFWGGTRTSLTHLPRYILSNKLSQSAGVRDYSMYGGGYAWSGTIAGVTFNTVVNCAIPFSNVSDFYVAGALFDMTGTQQNYTHRVDVDYPAVTNAEVMTVCPGMWAYSTNTTSARYVSPYALILFVDMSTTGIDQFLNRSSGSPVDAAAGFIFFTSGDSDDSSSYGVSAAGISTLDIDKRFYQGYKPEYRKLDSYTYNGHSYTVVKIAIVRQELSPQARLISQPFLHMGLINRTYEYGASSIRISAQNIYVLEYGCEYALG
jgi:hypothetical protein